MLRPHETRHNMPSARQLSRDGCPRSFGRRADPPAPCRGRIRPLASQIKAVAAQLQHQTSPFPLRAGLKGQGVDDGASVEEDVGLDVRDGSGLLPETAKFFKE